MTTMTTTRACGHATPTREPSPEMFARARAASPRTTPVRWVRWSDTHWTWTPGLRADDHDHRVRQLADALEAYHATLAAT